MRYGRHLFFCSTLLLALALPPPSSLIASPPSLPISCVLSLHAAIRISTPGLALVYSDSDGDSMGEKNGGGPFWRAGNPFGEQIAQPRHHRQLTTSSTVDRTARVAIPRHHCPPVLTPSSPPNRPLGHTILPAVNAIDSTLQPSPPLRLPQSLSPPSAVLSLLLPPLGLPAHRLATMLATSDTLTAISAAALCPSSTWSYLCCGAVFDTRGTSPSSPLTQPPSPTPPSPLPATLPLSLPPPSLPPAIATPAAQLRCL